jgi:hypothetical protein
MVMLAVESMEKSISENFWIAILTPCGIITRAICRTNGQSGILTYEVGAARLFCRILLDSYCVPRIPASRVQGLPSSMAIEVCNHVNDFALQGNMELRNGNDRRKANPFGTSGPWLTTGKMGGLVITDRRKSTGRRTTDRQQNQGFSASTGF